MRFETDASEGKLFASEIRGVTADDVVGQDCNRTVIFAPHAQNNYDVHVTNVQSAGCGQGCWSLPTRRATPAPGAFFQSSIAGVVVTSGSAAQVGSPGTNGVWTVGQSGAAFAKDVATQASWSVVYAAGTYRCSGSFSAQPSLIMTTVGLVQPTCS